MVVVSLDMFLNNTQDTFVKYKNDKFCLVKGNKKSGKTISTIFKTLYLKRNYCFELNDKILFISSKEEIVQVMDIFNYINRSDLYKSIIPSDNIEVHILTFEDLIEFNKDRIYTHIIIDNIEMYNKVQIHKILNMFKKESYSKVYYIQNSLDVLDKVMSIVEYSRGIIGSKEIIYKFRYVIDDEDQDEFTQISMTPEIKYLSYEYKDFVDFESKKVYGYYTSCGFLYKDMGTFLHNLTNKCVDIYLVDRYLRIEKSIKVLREWINYKKGLYFVVIDDEGMSKSDLFREDMVLIDSQCEINNGDVVVIYKDNYLYARKYIEEKDCVKFVSEESIFSDIAPNDNVRVLGKVISYIRQYNNY